MRGWGELVSQLLLLVEKRLPALNRSKTKSQWASCYYYNHHYHDIAYMTRMMYMIMI